jgi:hypothetical protein
MSFIMLLTRGQACMPVVTQSAPADLAARYREALETQVNVTPHVQLSESSSGGATYNYRIGGAASAEKPQTFDLLAEFDSIGISGHDPVAGVSLGVGFDFDSVAGHKAGLSDDRLEAMLGAVRQLPYAEVRRSTGGAGYHIWIWFDSANLPRTENRAEHKALARAVLQQMCRDTGHDLAADVDCCGAILWICARRATAENGGLTLVKAAREPLKEIPTNWREHLEVVKGTRRRTRVRADMSDSEADAFDETYQDRPRVPIGAEHRVFADRLGETGFHTSWNQDHGCLVTHTFAIKSLKAKYGLRGVFDTVSEGADPHHPNCFLFPLEDGAWRAFRFTPGTPECKPVWEMSPNGWTTCVVNETPTMERAAVCCRGIVSPHRSGEAFLFRDAADVKEMIEALSGKISFPSFVEDRQLSVRRKDGASLIVEFERQDADDAEVDAAWKLGWTKDKQAWATVVKIESRGAIVDHAPWIDKLVRHVSQDGKQISLFSNTKRGWQQHNTDRVRDFVIYCGTPDFLVSSRLGWCAANPWELVSIPFEREYPGDRRWNRNSAKLYYAPSSFPGTTSYWDMVLNHIGRGLDEAVESDDWCRAHGIETGSDYLRRWASIMIRTPARRLPMLFFYSCPEQNTGKSIFHEGLSTLLDTKGYTFADKALTLQSGFNAELRGAVLCIVEETNIAKSDLAYTRLKAWITGPSLQIHPKGKDSFLDTNFTHWIMTANDPGYLPIEAADTRIIISEVPPYEGEDIAKDVLLGHLRKEGPQFLHQFYSYDISDSAGRHTLPVLFTTEKRTRIEKLQTDAKFDGLEGVPRQLCEAIIAMPKPFSGDATQLNEALGDWDGQQDKKKERSRVTSVGRNMQRLKVTLAKHDISVEIEPGRHSTYHIAC